MAKTKSKVKSKIPFINQMNNSDPLYVLISNAILDANVSNDEYRDMTFLLLGWCHNDHHALEGFKMALKIVLKRRKVGK